MFSSCDNNDEEQDEHEHDEDDDDHDSIYDLRSTALETQTSSFTATLDFRSETLKKFSSEGPWGSPTDPQYGTGGAQPFSPSDKRCS